jgi:hypothetical protein
MGFGQQPLEVPSKFRELHKCYPHRGHLPALLMVGTSVGGECMALRLNHMGLVFPKISDLAEMFRALGLSEMTAPEPDPVQKVSASFIDAPSFCYPIRS